MFLLEHQVSRGYRFLKSTSAQCKGLVSIWNPISLRKRRHNDKDLQAASKSCIEELTQNWKYDSSNFRSHPSWLVGLSVPESDSTS